MFQPMASRCAVGPTAFSQHCRKLTALAPMQYVTHLRVQAACAALRADAGRNVTEIALSCGFSSGQYFANVFRRLTGVAPGAYRRDPDAARVKNLPLEVIERRAGGPAA